MPGDELVVATWNVDGIGSSTAELAELLASAKPHAVCLQEVRRKAPAEFPGYVTHWTPATAPHSGYAGTAVLVRDDLEHTRVAFAVGMLDDEGRTTAVRLHGHAVTVVSVYAPNAGVNKATPLARLETKLAWEAAFGKALAGLRGSVVIAGDLNVAVREIDVHNPKALRRKAGFTAEEREAHMKHVGYRYADAWCTVHGADAPGFTFWGRYPGIKEADKGWRLDYQLTTAGLHPTSATICREFESSDHVPLIVTHRFHR